MPASSLKSHLSAPPVYDRDVRHNIAAKRLIIYKKLVVIISKSIMQEIADKYQEEIDQKFANMIATLEPTLVIILSLIVGMILLSVMLPLMGIMSSL